MSFSPITGQASTAIHTPNDGLDQGEFDLPVSDGTIKAYYAAPSVGTNFPVILVIQEIFGVHEHIRDVCRRFAKEGYLAVSAELYQRQGDASEYTDIPSLIAKLVSKVPDDQVMADLDACVRWAATRGANVARLGVTGFCWGGRQVWLYAAHNPACKAAVAWYGKLAAGHGPLQKHHPVEIAGSIHAPLLGLYGGKDTSIPQEDVRRVEEILADGNEAARASKIVVYPQSGHAFYADYRPSYHADDAKDGWKRTLDWFHKYLA